jgi:hypothetical protein
LNIFFQASMIQLAIKRMELYMGQLKECDARDRLSAGRSKSRTLFSAGDINRNHSSGIESNAMSTEKTTFVEDFMLEHSHANLLIAMMGSAGRHGTAVIESHKSTQHYGFPS